MKAQEYLDCLTEQIRYQPARYAVREEVRAHIEDQRLAYEARGLGPEEAEVLAVRQMGDPVEAGVELDRVHRPRMAWGMFVLAGVLCAVWMVLPRLLSVGNVYENVQELLPRGLFAVFCMGIMLVVCYLDYSRIGRYAGRIALVAGGLCLVGMVSSGVSPGISGDINGTGFWVFVMGMARIDFRLCLLLYVPLYAAILYSYRNGGRKDVGTCLLWLLPPLGMAFCMADVATAFLLLFCCGTLFVVVVCKKWYHVSTKFALCGFGFMMTSVVLAFAAYIFFAAPKYQVDRAWNLLGRGEPSYMFRRVSEVLAGSRWLGRANGRAAGEILSKEGHGLCMGDFMLTELGGHYGMVFAAVLAAAIVFLLSYLLRACLRQKNQLGMLMGLGCALVLLQQTGCYILLNAGIVNLGGGFFCPFVTYGRGGMLLTSVLLGILLSVYRYQNVLPKDTAVERLGRIRVTVLPE